MKKPNKVSKKPSSSGLKKFYSHMADKAEPQVEKKVVKTIFFLIVVHVFIVIILGLHGKLNKNTASTAKDTLLLNDSNTTSKVVPESIVKEYVEVPDSRQKKSRKKVVIATASKSQKITANKVKTVPATKSTTSNSWHWYQLQAGDTLYKISKKFNVSVDKLKQINQIHNPNQLKIGTKIKVRVVKK